MIRLEVIEKSKNTEPDVISNPLPAGLALADFYKEKLTEAAAAQAEILCFDAIPFEEKVSVNFQNIHILEKCIMDFFREHQYPKRVRIVCDTADVAELYKVVYNFYYPGSKAERLDDDKWD
ncbi:MAG: hypothetical protein ACI39W_01710 [Brotaphodocola sp.]